MGVQVRPSSVQFPPGPDSAEGELVTLGHTTEIPAVASPASELLQRQSQTRGAVLRTF